MKNIIANSAMKIALPLLILGFMFVVPLAFVWADSVSAGGKVAVAAQTGGGQRNTGQACIDYLSWRLFFAMAFFCGANAGLKHLGAVRTSDKAKKIRLMDQHSNWWKIAVPVLALAFWAFWYQVCFSWVWYAIPAGVIAAIFVFDFKKQ